MAAAGGPTACRVGGMEHKAPHNQHCAALPVVQSDALPEALLEVLQIQLADQIAIFKLMLIAICDGLVSISTRATSGTDDQKCPAKALRLLAGGA